MRFTSPSRRALGLLAASTIGMSTAVLGVTGVASASHTIVTLTPATTTFSSPTATGVSVGAGVCAITWTVVGASGGADSATVPGDNGGRLVVTSRVDEGDFFELHPGAVGTAAAGTQPGVGGQSNAAADYSGEGGTYIGPPDEVAGGGGGAASVVVGAEAVALSAFGGDGGGGELSGFGGYVDSPGFNTNSIGGTPTTDGTSTTSGPGSITGTAVLCGAPSEVQDLQVSGGDGSATIEFFDGPTVDDDNAPLAPVTGYEVQVDGGAWSPLTVTSDSFDKRSGSVAVVNGPDTHTVAVRATSAVGPGAPASVSGVVAVTDVAAPTNLTVTPGVTSVLVTWAAPADTAGITAYQAFATPLGAQSSGSTIFCETDTATFSCLVGVPAGEAYFVGVTSLDESGNPGDNSFTEVVETPVIAAPALPTSVPTRDDGDIVGPAGPITSVTAGQKLTLQGSGFLPFTTVQLTVFSAPVSLGTVVTDENGAFSVEVTLPANLANGTHTLVATGIAPDGTSRNLVITVTVSGGTVVVTNASLANTGFDTAVPLTGGALAVLAGAGLLVGARRRSTV